MAGPGQGQFPVGLRVLVVDDDMTFLRVLGQMLRRCSYHVTTCSEATVALNLLREQKGCFDVVLSDVHMPDMDGYKLLEHVGLEMDLPVIMMSADQRTSAVMKGIRHGACDYLIKPIREEELKIIWQHVFRKKWNGNKEPENSGCLEDSNRYKKGSNDADYASSINEGTEGMLKAQKKRRDAKEEDEADLENDDPSNSKRPRVVWSVELHQQFVSAVNQLGIDKAVPKRILELMNVPGLTRENVASHLQKFRLYLKRLSGVVQQGGNSLCGSMESTVHLGSSGERFDIQALAASGQISPQMLAALHTELYGQPTGGIMLSTMDQQSLLQASLQGSNGISVEHGVAFRQPLIKCQTNISKHDPQSVVSVEGVSSGFGAWSVNSLGTVGQNGNAGVLQQQSMSLDSSHSINVQPSCLVIPSGSSVTFQAENSPVSINQNNGYRISVVSTVSSQSNNSSLGIGAMSDLNPLPTGILTEYSGPRGSSSCSMQADNGSKQEASNSAMIFSADRQSQGMVPNTQCSYYAMSGEKTDQQLSKNPSFVDKGSCIPSRFAVNEMEFPASNLNHGKIFQENHRNKVKQEPNLDFVDNAKVGIPMFLNFSTNDIMRVLYE